MVTEAEPKSGWSPGRQIYYHYGLAYGVPPKNGGKEETAGNLVYLGRAETIRKRLVRGCAGSKLVNHILENERQIIWRGRPVMRQTEVKQGVAFATSDNAAPEKRVKLPGERGNGGDFWLADTTIAIDSFDEAWGIALDLRTVYVCTRAELEQIWSERRIPDHVRVSQPPRDILSREVIERSESDVRTYSPEKPKQIVRGGNRRNRLAGTSKHKPGNIRRSAAGKRIPVHKAVHQGSMLLVG